MYYHSAISTGGIGGGIPSQINSLRAKKPPGLMQNLFNVPVYQRDRLNDQQKAEMQRQSDDSFRGGTWRAASDLDRAHEQSNASTRFNQLGAATDSAMRGFDTMTRQAEIARQNALQGLDLFQQLQSHPLLQSLFAQ
jgi:hypothetical protein